MKYKLNLNVSSKNKVIRKSVYYNKKLYYILNYDKSVLCYNNYEAAIYRSVIFSATGNKVLCFSPTKSLTNDVFINKYPEINHPEFIVNEYIEGVMINLFYDVEHAKWEIATRSCVGGRNVKYNYSPSPEMTYISSYYHLMGINIQSENRKTFYQMFLDALLIENHDLNDIIWIHELPKSFSYCFILQHPANKIVVPVKNPKLYLVSVFYIGKHDVEYVSPFEYEKWQNFDNRIYFPEKKMYYEYEDLYADITNMAIHLPGYMLINTQTGEKTKLSNPNYEKFKKNKNVSPLLQYQYLCYRRAYMQLKNSIHTADELSTKLPVTDLNPYPKEVLHSNLHLHKTTANEQWIHKIGKSNKIKNQMLDVNMNLEEFIRNVYNAYKNKYIYKSRTPIAEKYDTHIHKIHHTIFIPSLKTHKTPITLNIVKGYFNAIEPRELLYIINEDRRNIGCCSH